MLPILEYCWVCFNRILNNYRCTRLLILIKLKNYDRRQFKKYNTLKWIPEINKENLRTKTYCELVDDGAGAPAVLERDVGEVAVGVVAEVQHLVAAPPRQILQLLHCALLSINTYVCYVICSIIETVIFLERNMFLTAVMLGAGHITRMGQNNY